MLDPAGSRAAAARPPRRKRRHAAPQRVTGRTPRLVALIPAHNEQNRIDAAVRGLREQTRPPDAIVVVADNCTDGTADMAQWLDADVFHTRDNSHRKPGALNQAIAWLLPHLDDQDLLLVQDAGTVLNPWFVETAIDAFSPKVGAVGGVPHGGEGGGLLGLLQRMELHRHAWEIEHTGGRARVLAGTGTVFRARVLRQIRTARRVGLVGGRDGDGYYSLTSPAGNDEITKAVKTLGYRALSPAGCTLTTEVMTTFPALWHQRLRRRRGALENLRAYGWTRVTVRQLLRQSAAALGTLSLLAYLAFMALTFTTSPFWIAVGAALVLARTIPVHRAGPRAFLLAALLVPEAAYAVFRHAADVTALWSVLVPGKQRNAIGAER